MRFVLFILFSLTHLSHTIDKVETLSIIANDSLSMAELPPTMQPTPRITQQEETADSTTSKNLPSRPADGCRDLHRSNDTHRCDHVREHCGTDEYNIGVFNYLKLYYCSFPKAFSSIFASTVLLFSFAGLGKTAADFLSPNLYTISKALQLSDHLAGLTLLAIGNSAADILGTFKALSVGSAELAISELIGATLFVLTVVVGSICIIHPFKVPAAHHTRDSISYLLVLVVVEIALQIGTLTIAMASCLVSIYIIYVIIAVVNHLWMKFSQKKKMTAARIRSNFDRLSPSLSPIDTNREDSPSCIETLEDASEQETQMNNELERYFSAHPEEEPEFSVPVQTGSYGLKVLLKELSHHTSRFNSSKQPLLNSFDIERDGSDERITGENEEDAGIDDNRRLHPLASQGAFFMNRSLLWEALSMLLPTWDINQHPLQKVLFVLTYPANVALSFTAPVREKALTHASNVVHSTNAFTLTSTSQESLTSIEERYNIRLDLMIYKLQFVCGTTMLAFMHSSYSQSFLIVAVSVTLCSSLISYICLPSRCPQFESQMLAFRLWNYIGSVLGFIISIHWISIFATEVIAILKQYALILRLSDEIMGFTVFAMGNSVGDLVSNLTIALMGMPLMAFAACFGGPLLSLCSLGLSALVMMSKTSSHSITLSTSRTLKLNVLVIILVLIFMNVYYSISHYKADKRLGVILIFFWIFTVSGSAYMEIR